MVQIDVPIALALGAVAADAAREGLTAGRPLVYWRTMSRSLLFFVFAVSWLPLYLLVMHFGFETSHMWWHRPTLADYPFFVPVFMTIFFGANVAGFVLGAHLVRRGRLGLNRAIMLAVAVFATGWIFARPHRTLVLGSYEEWAAGAAPPIASDPGLVSLLVVYGVGFTLLLVGFYRWLRRRDSSTT